MERWEPPSGTAKERERPRRPPQPVRDRRDVWAQVLAAVAGRAGVAILLMAPRFAAIPSLALDALTLGVLVALLAVSVLAWRSGLPRWSAVWIVDTVSLGVLTPLLVMNGFVAAETNPLLPAERSAYLQTVFGVIAALVITAWVARRFAVLLPGMAGILILPGALQLPSLVAVLNDYRDMAVLSAIAGTYAVGAVVVLGGWFLPVAIHRWLAAAVWVGFAVVLSVTKPGLSALNARHDPITFWHPLLLGLALACLLLVSLPPLPPRAGRARRSRRAARWRGRRVRGREYELGSPDDGVLNQRDSVWEDRP